MKQDFFKKLPTWKQANGMKVQGAQPVPAGVCEGVAFYRFPSESSTPSLRALSALRVYQELEINLDRETFKNGIQAVIGMIREGSTEKAVIILEGIGKQLDKTVSIEMLYRLAGATYFRADQNPLEWNEAEAGENIRIWKQSAEAPFFLFQRPIKDFYSFNPESTTMQNLTDLFLSQQGNDAYFSLLMEKYKNQHPTEPYKT